MALNMQPMIFKVAGGQDIKITGGKLLTITTQDLDDYLNAKTMVWPKAAKFEMEMDVELSPAQSAAFQLLIAELGVWQLNYTWAFQYFRLALYLRHMLLNKKMMGSDNS